MPTVLLKLLLYLYIVYSLVIFRKLSHVCEKYNKSHSAYDLLLGSAWAVIILQGGPKKRGHILIIIMKSGQVANILANLLSGRKEISHRQRVELWRRVK